MISAEDNRLGISLAIYATNENGSLRRIPLTRLARDITHNIENCTMICAEKRFL